MCSVFLWNSVIHQRALQHLHDKGVVHGDLKPPNILWDADSATFKLIDFGVSFTTSEDLTHAVQSKGKAAIKTFTDFHTLSY